MTGGDSPQTARRYRHAAGPAGKSLRYISIVARRAAMQPRRRDTEDQAVDLGGTGRAPVGGAGDAAAPEQTETSGPAVAAEAAPVSADPAAPALTTASGQAMAPGQAAGPGPAATPSIRASDRERDAATQQLQAAFAEGRIDDAEFDERMRTALTARPRGEIG